MEAGISLEQSKNDELLWSIVEKTNQQDVIRPSASPWASPIVLMNKKMAQLGSVWITGS